MTNMCHIHKVVCVYHRMNTNNKIQSVNQSQSYITVWFIYAESFFLFSPECCYWASTLRIFSSISYRCQPFCHFIEQQINKQMNQSATPLPHTAYKEETSNIQSNLTDCKRLNPTDQHQSIDQSELLLTVYEDKFHCFFSITCFYYSALFYRIEHVTWLVGTSCKSSCLNIIIIIIKNFQLSRPCHLNPANQNKPTTSVLTVNDRRCQMFSSPDFVTSDVHNVTMLERTS